MSDIEIRDANTDDLDAMRSIYNEVLLTSTSIFHDVPRTEDEQIRWFADRRAQGWPVLVACEAGQVIGYASYGPFRSWPGYRYTVENSIYLALPSRGRGIGKRLLGVLLDRAHSQSLHAVVAGIDGDNEISMKLHEQLGFKKVAHLQQVGRKFDRWLDLTFYEYLVESASKA